jgi:hypothetical protein
MRFREWDVGMVQKGLFIALCVVFSCRLAILAVAGFAVVSPLVVATVRTCIRCLTTVVRQLVCNACARCVMKTVHADQSSHL